MSDLINLDITIEDKYEYTGYSLLQEFERIKLPVIHNTICSNAHFKAIDSSQHSWGLVQQSRLIESLIINIPVLPIIVYRIDNEDRKVIDGRERLKAINKFYSNQLTLSGLEVETELNGCTYNNLPIRLKSLLNRRSLYFISIIPDTNLEPDKITKLIDIIAQRLGNERNVQDA